MATIGNIDTKITQLTGADTSSTGYPSATRVIDINAWQQLVQTMIISSQDESDFDDARNTTYPIKYLSLVAGQRDYSIPQTDKIIGVKRVDISYDGVNFVRAEPIDSGEIVDGLGLAASTTQETTTDGNYSKSAPRYDYKYGAIMIYPRASSADVAAGAQLKYEGTREVTDFSTSDVSTGTLIPGFDSAFHAFLYLGPSYDYCVINNLPAAKGLQVRLQDLEGRLRRHYGKKQADRIMALKNDQTYNSYK